MAFDTTHPGYAPAVDAFNRAAVDKALCEIEAIRNRFHVIRDGLVAADNRAAIPLLEDDLWDALARLEDELRGQ